MFSIINYLLCHEENVWKYIVFFRCGPVASVSLLYTFSVYRSGPGMVLHIVSWILKKIYLQLISHGTGKIILIIILSTVRTVIKGWGPGIFPRATKSVGLDFFSRIIERRIVTTCYYGSKISGSQQLET